MMNNYHVPFEIFSSWIKEAKSNSNIIEAGVANIAIVNNTQNKPSSYMVMFKKFDKKGFYFCASLNLNDNNNIALCFYWGVLNRQVRVEGIIKKISLSEFFVEPKVIEFWTEGKFRIHKRIIYKKNKNSWNIFQIYP